MIWPVKEKMELHHPTNKQSWEKRTGGSPSQDGLLSYNMINNWKKEII